MNKNIYKIFIYNIIFLILIISLFELLFHSLGFEVKKKYLKPFLLSANKNYRLISKQIKKYKPNFFIINDVEIFKKIDQKFKKDKIKILNNFSSIKLKKKSQLLKQTFSKFVSIIFNFN